jgi:hypothetical protein
LLKNGVTAVHDERPGPHDTSRLIAFEWDAPAELTTVPPRVELHIELQLLKQGNINRFAVKMKLDVQQDGATQSVGMQLPEVADEADVIQRLFGSIVDAFGQLAMDITSGSKKAGKE